MRVPREYGLKGHTSDKKKYKYLPDDTQRNRRIADRVRAGFPGLTAKEGSFSIRHGAQRGDRPRLCTRHLPGDQDEYRPRRDFLR